MSRAYSEDELLETLGKPAEQGHFLGTTSAVGLTKTPWGMLRRVESGNDAFMRWDCEASDPNENPRENMCFALRPTWGPKAGRGWFVIQSCPHHAGLLEITRFMDLVPHVESSEEPCVNPRLLVVDSASYVNRSGEDWAKIAGLLDKGWMIRLVHDDHRFPDYTFIVMEK